MKYQVGTVGKVIVAKLEDSEEVLENMISLVKKEGIGAAAFFLMGGMCTGRVVVGPERDEIPPVPVWWEFGESHEIVGFGTIFYQNNEPKVHFHSAFGKHDSVKVGCLREKTKAFIVIEAVLIELCGINAERVFDSISGLSVLEL